MTRHLIVAAVAAAALATQAGAQSSDRHGGFMHGDMTRQQVTQFTDMMFQRFDLNHDGVVTRDEAQQALSQAGGDGSGHAERMLARLFGDAQSVTQAQAEAQALTRFDAQDLNHDGVVTAAEREQARANRAQSH
jgi:Ca2+-binding EF-hand superfamily protein